MKIFSTLLILIFFTYSCKHDSPFENIDSATINNPIVSDNCDVDTVYFVNTIKPLINNSCATTDCHDANTAEHGIVLDTYANIIISAEVKAFKPYDSKLYEVITDEGDDLMPPNKPFSSDQINLIKVWIEQGALNNSCVDGVCNTENMSFTTNIWPTLNNNCTSCHSGSSPSGGINIENYNDVKVLVDNSSLVNVLNNKNGAPLMPKNGKLDECSIDKIEQWINDGALNN